MSNDPPGGDTWVVTTLHPNHGHTSTRHLWLYIISIMDSFGQAQQASYRAGTPLNKKIIKIFICWWKLELSEQMLHSDTL